MNDALKQWNEIGAESFNSEDLDKKVKQLHELGRSYDAAKLALEEVSKVYSEIEKEILVILQKAKKSKYPVDGVGLVSIVNKYVVRLPDSVDKWRAFKEYCMKKYGPEYVDSSFKMHSATLTSFYNKEKEIAEDPSFQIPGIEAPTLVQSLRFKKE